MITHRQKVQHGERLVLIFCQPTRSTQDIIWKQFEDWWGESSYCSSSLLLFWQGTKEGEASSLVACKQAILLSILIFFSCFKNCYSTETSPGGGQRRWRGNKERKPVIHHRHSWRMAAFLCQKAGENITLFQATEQTWARYKTSMDKRDLLLKKPLNQRGLATQKA